MERVENLTWRQRERARTRKQILSAAKRIFAKKGFHKSSLEEIAREAGLGKGTIYWHFNDKADLVRAVFEDTIDEQLRWIERALGKPTDPITSIRAITKAQLTHFARNRYLLRVCAAESMFHSEEMKKQLRSSLNQKYTKYTRLLEETFAAAIKKGQLKKTDTRRLSHIFIALMHAICWYWDIYGVKPAPEKEARLVCEIVLEGLRKRR
jgi:AcrR family transcriptional regulator